ncbi:hypothetical protein INR49_001924 [Caranx melampygus]|nr:hypothetical protein INR49_001924 [Caranx melampygus]
MDSGAVDSPVTLVIKAPNQKYEDQTINCFLNWTVEKLKSHISIVYPSKPLSKDQRLVYSGRLLQDHLQLRDVLRKSPDSAGSASPATTPNQDPHSAPSSVPGSYDGLRYRGGFPPYNPDSPPGVPQWPGGAQVPLQGPHQPPQPNEAVQPPLGPNPAPNPLPENQPANPNIQMNAQGGAVLNDDELNRDWLDWLYTVSRAGVLLSIVYFYSSFSRFVMVVVPCFSHQAGWFPFRPEQQNLRGEQAGAPQEEAERHQDIQEMERLMDEGVEDDDSGEEGGGGPEDQAQAPAALPEPSFFTTAWSFISTFFTSLIPEGRPHAAN